MKSLIHKPLSLITKTKIRGLDAFTKAGRHAAAAKKGKASKKNSQTGGDGQESSKQRKAAKTNTKIGGDGQAPTKKRKLAK